MENCTRYAFTDGHCQQIENGCMGCPGKFENLKFRTEEARRKEGFWTACAINIPIGVIALCIAFGLAYQAKQGMERREAAYQADLRR